MPLITVGAGASELDPGTYPVTCVGVEQKTITVENEDRQVFEWKFNVDTDDPDEVIEVNGLTSIMTGPKSKTAQFISALLGPDALQPGAEFDLPDFVGKSALATVGLNKNGYPRVEGLVAIPKVAKRKATPVAVQQDDEDEDETPAPAPAKPKVKPIREQVADDETDLPF